MDKFTVEEINLMCVFEGQDRTGMIADIKNVLPRGICRGGIGSGGVIDANLL